MVALVLATWDIRLKKSVLDHSINSFSLLSTHTTGDDKFSNMTVNAMVFERISHVASTGSPHWDLFSVLTHSL
jgi:hypothetical protein